MSINVQTARYRILFDRKPHLLLNRKITFDYPTIYPWRGRRVTGVVTKVDKHWLTVDVCGKEVLTNTIDLLAVYNRGKGSDYYHAKRAGMLRLYRSEVEFNIKAIAASKEKIQENMKRARELD